MRALLFATVLLIPLWAYALKTWTTGETIKATDLNSNFSTVNTAANALVMDAKVSSSATISHSKLATPALVPKAWAVVSTSCTGSGTVCTLAANSKVTSITSNSVTAGAAIDVDLAYVPSNVNYAVVVTAIDTDSVCYAGSFAATAIGTTDFRISCLANAGGAPASVKFSVLVMDDN